MIEGLYIHIPFCHDICSYCDFYKIRAKDELKVKFIHYLIKELKLKKEFYHNLKTIYIGGGTPSSLDHELLEELFKTLHELININNIEEFTIEVNPTDINEKFIHLLKKYQVNRISLGVQSFDSKTLNILGRNHTSNQAIEALKLLQRYQFDNISVDLIYGLQSCNFKRVKKDIDITIKYGVKHFSIYSLIIEDKTYLGYLQKNNQFMRLDDNKDAIIYEQIVRYLKSLDYVQYEVSNFSKEGYQSQHNLIYWNNNNYVGVGPSASYFIGNTRYTNINHLNKYFAGIDSSVLCFLEKIDLNKEQMMLDEIMMGLRKTTGINKGNFFKKYQVSVLEAFPKLKNLIKEGIIIEEENYIYVKNDKLFILNAILVAIM